MKRYRICLYLLIGAGIICLMTGMAMTRHYRKELREEMSREVPLVLSRAAQQEMELRGETQSFEEVLPESAEAVNRERVSHETEAEEYYLVCEDGFLLVFLKDRKTICLYTHIPIADFPAREQDRLREGIGFSSMMEVFNYLESYTS